MITQDQLKDVLDRADALYKYLKIDEKKMEYEEEDLRTQAPDFWEDQKRAEEQMKKVKAIKKWLDGYQDVRTAADELQLAFDFYKEEMVTEQEVDANYQKAIEAIEAVLRRRTGHRCLCECISAGRRLTATRFLSPTCKMVTRQASRVLPCR